MAFIFNFIKRLIKLCIKLSLYLVVFAAIIVLIPNLPPYTKFTSIELEPSQAKVGPLAHNELLNNAEQKYKGKLLGPEAFQLYNGELYTSLATGEIVKISPGGHVTFVTKIGQPCSGLTKEHICGRPLGFQIDEKTNSMYIADAYHGIWKVDLRTDKKQLLVSPNVAINQRQPKFFNSIALAKNGDIYWTDSTSDFNLKDGVLGILADPSGRLLHYNAARNESKVLLDDLWFANGLVLSPNNEYLVVAESMRYRLVKYYIAGPKKGKSEVFVEGLPGVPDNIRTLPDGSGLLVGMHTVFDDENPMLTRSLAPTPSIRKFLVRLQRLIEIPFEYLNTLYPHYVFEEIVYSIGHFSSMTPFSSGLAGLLQVDWNGNIVAAYYNTDQSVGPISDGIVFNEKLYMGTPHGQDFIGVISAPPLLKSAFTPMKRTDAKKVETKPVEQTPKKSTDEKVKVEKPKVDQKPKVEVKPQVDQKPRPVETVKVTKPKVEEKQEAPKVAKPVATPPKPTAQTKPAEPAKPAQKPIDKQPTVGSKPAAPKATLPPPKTTPPPTPKPAQRQTETKTTTTPKPEVKTAPPAKSSEKVTPPPKTTPMPATQTKTDDTKTQQKPVKEQPPKPIREEIRSDTVKPKGETLKVIKKAGPAEIPAPNQ